MGWNLALALPAKLCASAWGCISREERALLQFICQGGVPFCNSHKDALCARGGLDWKELLRGIPCLPPLLCLGNSLGLYQSLHSAAHPPSPLVGGGVNYLMGESGRRNQAWTALLPFFREPAASREHPSCRWMWEA